MRPDLDEYFLATQVAPEGMDALWGEGWRHFGPYFFRYSRLYSNTVLPLRIRLANFSLSQSQRRVLKKNQDLQARLQPAFVNAEVEALFEQHKTRFSHSIPDKIFNFVSRRPARIPCRCHSLSLHANGRLVGISYLDEGETATSSVYQCFDPLYSRCSLGILMILLSIRFSSEWGKAFYYPGYAYQEPSEYDYKKRFAGLEFYNWKGLWLTFEVGSPISPPSLTEHSEGRALE